MDRGLYLRFTRVVHLGVIAFHFEAVLVRFWYFLADFSCFLCNLHSFCTILTNFEQDLATFCSFLKHKIRFSKAMLGVCQLPLLAGNHWATTRSEKLGILCNRSDASRIRQSRWIFSRVEQHVRTKRPNYRYRQPVRKRWVSAPFSPNVRICDRETPPPRQCHEKVRVRNLRVYAR